MNNIIVLTGPTGSGKSRIIYDLPQSLPIEIINADSRQIYRHLNIGTAMPSSRELQRFPHHLFAFLDPSQSFSAGQYLHKCKEIIQEILNRDKVPLIIGGTFFYIKALWDGLIESMPIDKNVANSVNNMSAAKALLELRHLDPDRASQLPPADEYRIKRSLMVCISAGIPISKLSKTGGIYSDYKFHSYYLDMDRAILYDQINQRVKLMFDYGLLDEITNLLKMGYNEDDPALKSIGYREILSISREYNIQPHDWSPQLIQKAMELISKETRHFAKRQLTWFRHEKRLKRIDHVFAVSLISELILKKE